MVFIHKKVYKKLEAFSKGVREGEIGGLMIGKIDKDDEIEVKDILLLKQTKTSVHFEIDDEDMMELTKTADSKLLSSIIGWWHSHGTFDAFWSTDDDECFKRLCNLSGMCLGVVVSLQRDDDNLMKMRWRLQIKNNNRQINIDDLKFKLEENWNLFNISNKYISKEINEKVEEDMRVWTTCPVCNGMGSLTDDEYEKKIKKAKKGKVELKDEYDDNIFIDNDGCIRDLYDVG